MEKVTAVPLIANTYHGRTIVGIKGKDEEGLWKSDSKLWGEPINFNDVVEMTEDDTAQELDAFREDVLLFASQEACDQYTAFCEGRLIN